MLGKGLTFTAILIFLILMSSGFALAQGDIPIKVGKDTFIFQEDKTSFYVEGLGINLYAVYGDGNHGKLNTAMYMFKAENGVNFIGENAKVNTINVINHKWNNDKRRGAFLRNGAGHKTIQIWYPSGDIKIID